MSRPAPTRAVLGCRPNGRTAKRHVTRVAAMQECARRRRCPRGASWGCRRVVSAGRGAANHEVEQKAPEAGPSPGAGAHASAARPRVSARDDRVGQVEAPESSSCGRGPADPGRTWCVGRRRRRGQVGLGRASFETVLGSRAHPCACASRTAGNCTVGSPRGPLTPPAASCSRT